MTTEAGWVGRRLLWGRRWTVGEVAVAAALEGEEEMTERTVQEKGEMEYWEEQTKEKEEEEEEEEEDEGQVAITWAMPPYRLGLLLLRDRGSAWAGRVR